MFLFWCLVLLSCDLPRAGSLLASKDFGSSLLIPLGLQTQDPPFLVLWKKGNTLLGRIRGGQCTYGCEMSSVLSNGSLFLSHVQREDEGTYIADVFNASGILIHHAEIGLQVVDGFADHMFDLSLESKSPDHSKQVIWRKGNEDVGHVSMGKCILGCNERSEVFSNGSLFLHHVQKEDEGMYSALVFNSSSFPIHHADILLYVNVSEVEVTKTRRMLVSSVVFIGLMTVFCLSLIIFVTLGRLMWKLGNLEKTGNGEYSVSYIEIQRNTSQKYAEFNSSSNVIETEILADRNSHGCLDQMENMGKANNSEEANYTEDEMKEPEVKEINEVVALSTFQ